MNDHTTWDNAVHTLRREYEALPTNVYQRCSELVNAIRRTKADLHATTTSINCGDICRSCAGECCRSGKYHVTVIDILPYLLDDIPLFTPRFDKGHCPYLGASGCLMDAELRPFTCITFNCSRIEELLTEDQRANFSAGTDLLRVHFSALEHLFCNRFMAGILIAYERDIVAARSTMLRWQNHSPADATGNPSSWETGFIPDGKGTNFPAPAG